MIDTSIYQTKFKYYLILIKTILEIIFQTFSTKCYLNLLDSNIF